MQHPRWRLAREAEGAPLLREYGVKSSIEGSNPSVSASYTGHDFVIPGPVPGHGALKRTQASGLQAPLLPLGLRQFFTHKD